MNSRLNWRIPLLVIVLAASCLAGCAQQDTILLMADTTQADTSGFANRSFVKGFKAKWNMQPHSPLKATIRSAIFPGLGQAYNKKYWKMPIVYAGLGTCIGFIAYNNKKYQYWRQEYIYQVDDDPNTNPEINATNLFEIQDQYHRWRDVSYFALAAVYILQVIDANVDAHLFYYDVSRDLGLSVQPAFIPSGRLQPGIGLSLSFK